MKKIAIYGAGSFGMEVKLLIDKINAHNPTYEFIGFFDDTKEIGSVLRYGKVIGSIKDINQNNDTLHLAIAVGVAKDLHAMRFNIVNPKVNFPNLLAPDNIFFDKDSLKIGVGNIILSNSIISYDVKLGDFNIINTRVNFGHHVEIGDFNVLNPNVQLSGNTRLGNFNSLGLNSAVLPKKTIGDSNVVAPGSIISKKFNNNTFLAGNPAVNIKL
jgi:sugar O-acyltransferase (sialic acid O-acetyltransferase NeuD family)